MYKNIGKINTFDPKRYFYIPIQKRRKKSEIFLFIYRFKSDVRDPVMGEYSGRAAYHGAIRDGRSIPPVSVVPGGKDEEKGKKCWKFGKKLWKIEDFYGKRDGNNR